MKHIPHFINNKSVNSQNENTFDSINPSNQKVWAKAALGGELETNSAVKAARRAFDKGPWPKMRAEERASILYEIADKIENNIEELAEIETQDMGKDSFSDMVI